MKCLPLVVAIVVLVGCWAPRVAPVGQLTPDPENPGAYVMNPALPQPAAEDYEGGGPLGTFAGLLGEFAPSPFREGIIALTGLFCAIRGRRYKRALQQTVGGIEGAKREKPELIPALHAALAEQQDEDAKRVVWEMRP